MSELGYIPKPLPDEILYSIIARLQSFAIYDSPGQLSLDLFGERNVPATIDLPSHIHFFHKTVKRIFPYSADEIIERFTLWPYYKQFTSTSKRKDALRRMKSNNGSGLHNLIGINASAMSRNKGLKYCVLCAQENFKKFGLYYWHRVHQIPDLYLCPYHFCYLQRHVVGVAEVSRSFFVDANQVLSGQIELNNIQYPTDWKLIDLTNQINSILHRNSNFNINDVNYAKTIQHTIFHNGTRVITADLTNAFEEYYGKKLLDLILPKINLCWVAGIIKRPHHYFHPIRHLMMANFLSHAPLKKKEAPLFGEGPWPCINKASDHLGKNVVTDFSIQLDRKTKRQIGRFKCTCGLVYTKSYLGNSGDESQAFIRIIDWGPTWLKALKKDLKAGRSFRTAGKRLGTDAKTVSIYASKKKLENTNIPINKKTLESKRKKWEKLLLKFDVNRVLQARNNNLALYIWLYRHDNKWLLVINKKYSTLTSTAELRLDWKNLDASIVDLILETVERLKKEKYRGRITKSLISKIIGSQHYLLGKNANKFPKSNSVLNSETESEEIFHTRRFQQAILELRGTTHLKRWQIMKKAGLGKRIANSAIAYLEKELSYGS